MKLLTILEATQRRLGGLFPVDKRENTLRTDLSDDEDRCIDYLADELGLSRAALARLAIMEFASNQLEKLSRFEEMYERAIRGRKSLDSRQFTERRRRNGDRRN